MTDDWFRECPKKYKEFLKHFNLSKKIAEEGFLNSWSDYRIGKITEDEFWKRFFIKTKTKKQDTAKAKSLWRECQRPIESMLNLLKKLKTHYVLTALTTISQEWLDYKKEKYKLENYFETIISSGYYKLRKPNLTIYKILLKKLSAKPFECVLALGLIG